MHKQAYWMKEAYENISAAERSRQKREREQQKKKEQNELHEMIMKEVQQSMQTMFKQPHQHHCSDNDSDIDEAHHVETMEDITVSECYNLSHLRQPPTKKTKTQHFAPITTAILGTHVGKSSIHKLRVLFDSGSSGSIIVAKFVKNLHIENDTKTEWLTNEFYESKVIEWILHVDKTFGPHQYDMIIGRDLMSQLGIILDFDRQTMTWDESTIKMKEYEDLFDINSPINEFHWHEEIYESQALIDASSRLKKILDAKYEPADLDKIARNCDYLTDDEQMHLLSLLHKYQHLFDGSLGTWNAKPYNIELKPDAKPYHSRPFPVPKIHEATLKIELERLTKAGVLKKVNQSEWAAPTFLIPKKDAMVRFISNFRKLNKRIKRKPYPIPKIQDLLLKLEGFQYATTLDLNMGYYHIELSPFSKRLCTIVTPFGKYEYQHLPMGLCNSADIFQERMYEIFSNLEYVRVYIDDLLVTSCSTFEEHLQKLELVFSRLSEAGLKINANKSHFAVSEIEYLGYWITRNGIQPVHKKVEAIQRIAPPTTKKQVRSFIGLINYYRDMWPRRSEILAPLTRLTSKDVPFQWTDVEQQAFDKIKSVVCREVLLSYPDFNKPFHIHTDASHYQLGAVISQDNRPIAFYSRKLQPAQVRYTTTERELLSIVETLKEFRNILLGQ
jgi:hypothetical protein